MRQILALEWDHGQVCGLLGLLTPGKVQVRRAVLLNKPPLTAAAGESAHIPLDWLKSELGRLGMTEGEVVVTLPRDEAVVRRIEVPPATDAELPVLVRFQAGAKSQALLEESSLDFLPLPPRPDVAGREVLMATVSQSTLTELRSVMELAGLQLTGVTLTPAALAELVARTETGLNHTAGESLVVARHGLRVEISVLRRQHLLFSHSARLNDEGTDQGTQAISAEVSRALVALRGAVPNVKIERVWTIVGKDEHQQLAESLKRRLNCDVAPLDLQPYAEWEPGSVDPSWERSLFAGPLGVLWSRAAPLVPGLDFLAPRQPPVVRDTRKRKMILTAIGVGVFLLLIGAVQAMRISSLSAQIEKLQGADRELALELKRGEATLKSAELVDQWLSQSVEWLDEVREVSRRLPGTDRLFLESLKLDIQSGSAPAHIKMGGYARTRQDVMRLNDLFVSPDERYKLLPHGDYDSSSAEGYYPSRFDSQLLLNPPAKAKPVRPPSPAPQSNAPTGKKLATGGEATPALKPISATRERLAVGPEGSAP